MEFNCTFNEVSSVYLILFSLTWLTCKSLLLKLRLKFSFLVAIELALYNSILLSLGRLIRSRCGSFQGMYTFIIWFWFVEHSIIGSRKVGFVKSIAYLSKNIHVENSRYCLSMPPNQSSAMTVALYPDCISSHPVSYLTVFRHFVVHIRNPYKDECRNRLLKKLKLKIHCLAIRWYFLFPVFFPMDDN